MKKARKERGEKNCGSINDRLGIRQSRVSDWAGEGEGEGQENIGQTDVFLFLQVEFSHMCVTGKGREREKNCPELM